MLKRVNDENENSIEDLAGKRFFLSHRNMIVICLIGAVMIGLSFLLLPMTKTWYALSRKDETGGQGIYSEDTGAGVMPYTLYVARPRTDQITQIDHVDVYSGGSDAVLNTFDSIFGGDSNKYTAAFIRVPVYGVPAGKDVKFTVTCRADYLDDQDQIERYISNIIQMSCCVIPTNVIAENASVATLYENARVYFLNHVGDLTEKTFVDYSVETQNGVKSIDVSGKMQENDQRCISFVIPDSQIDASDEKAFVYFKIDYNEDLVYHYIRSVLWGKGGFKIGETSDDAFSGTISENPMVYDLVDISITVLDN